MKTDNRSIKSQPDQQPLNIEKRLRISEKERELSYNVALTNSQGMQKILTIVGWGSIICIFAFLKDLPESFPLFIKFLGGLTIILFTIALGIEYIASFLFYKSNSYRMGVFDAAIILDSCDAFNVPNKKEKEIRTYMNQFSAKNKIYGKLGDYMLNLQVACFSIGMISFSAIVVFLFFCI